MPIHLQFWFAFRACDRLTVFGFGTDAQAFRFEDLLNADLESDLYTAHPLTTAETIDFHLYGIEPRRPSIDLNCPLSDLVRVVVSDYAHI